MVQLNEPEARAPTPEELFEAMSAQGSDEIDLVLQRKPEPGKTFSIESINQITEAFKIFLGARLAARWSKLADIDNEPGPSQAKISVSLEIDGERLVVPPELRPWFVLDGEAR